MWYLVQRNRFLTERGKCIKYKYYWIRIKGYVILFEFFVLESWTSVLQV